MKKSLSVFFIVLILFSGCATYSSYRSVPNDKGEITLSRADTEEIHLGEQINATILDRAYPYMNSQVNDYVDKVGMQLAKQSERSYLPYHFTILQDDRIYSSFAPGGYVYITTGMLSFLENEMELAAVLAHEISRIQYHFYGMSQMKEAVGAIGSLSQLAGFVFPPAGFIAPLGMVAVDSYLDKQKSPAEQTNEADVRSLSLMLKSGFDPQGAIDVMYKFASLKKEDLNKIINYNQSHPITPQRVDKLYAGFKQLDMANTHFETHWDQYHQAMTPLRETSGH